MSQSGLDVDDINFEQLQDRNISGSLSRPKVNISIDNCVYTDGPTMHTYYATPTISLFLLVSDLGIESEKYRRSEINELITAIVEELANKDYGVMSKNLKPVNYNNVTDRRYSEAAMLLFQLNFQCSFVVEEKEDISTDHGKLLKIINKYFLCTPDSDGYVDYQSEISLDYNNSEAIELLTIARNSLDTFDTLIDEINIIVDSAIAVTTQPERDAIYPEFVAKLDEIDQLCLDTKWNGYQIWPAPLIEGKKSLTTSIYDIDYLGTFDKRLYISKRLYADHNKTNRAELAPLGENDPSSVLFFNIAFDELMHEDNAAYLSHRESYIPFVPNVMTVAFTQMDSNGLFVVNPFGSLYGGVRDTFNNFDFDTAIMTDALIGYYKTSVWLGGSIADKLELLKYIVSGDRYGLSTLFGIANNLNMYAQLGNIDCPGTGKGRVIKQRQYIKRYLKILQEG